MARTLLSIVLLVNFIVAKAQINPVNFSRKQELQINEDFRKSGIRGFITKDYSSEENLNQDISSWYNVTFLDSVGREIRKVRYDSSKKLVHVEDNEYDSLGFHIRKFNYDGNLKLTGSNVYLYDDSGEQVEAVQYDGDGTIRSKTIVYYTKGRPSRKLLIGPNGRAAFEYLIEFNDQGYPIKTTRQLMDGRKFSASTWIYRADNLPLREINNGKVILQLTYDSTHRIIESRQIARNGFDISSTTYYNNGIGRDVENLGLSIPPAMTDPEFKTSQRYYLKNLAQFPGSQRKLERFIVKQTKGYKLREGGTVSVNFDVDTDGTISNAKISRSVSKETDEIAIKIIYSMPPWIPRKKSDGTVTKSNVTLGIHFKVSN